MLVINIKYQKAHPSEHQILIKGRRPYGLLSHKSWNSADSHHEKKPGSVYRYRSSQKQVIAPCTIGNPFPKFHKN